MHVTLLVLQRAESYDGEFAPEVLAVVDEYTNDENPEFWPAEVKRVKDRLPDEEVEAWAEIVVEINEDTIRERLRPALSPIDGHVI